MRNSEQGKPQWIKLWAEKYYDELCIDEIKDFYPTAAEERSFLMEVGKAFISALSYYNSYFSDDPQYTTYNMDRDGMKLYRSLKRDIDQSYQNYMLRVENGKKGGRPSKDDE